MRMRVCYIVIQKIYYVNYSCFTSICDLFTDCASYMLVFIPDRFHVTPFGIPCYKHSCRPVRLSNGGSCTVAYGSENPMIPLPYNVRIIHEILRKQNGKKPGEWDAMKPCSSFSMQMQVVPLKCLAPQATTYSYIPSPLEGLFTHCLNDLW
jgi:hypothetical protein